MPDFAIVTQEMRRLARRVLPMALIVFGVLVLAGQPVVETLVGVGAGTAFALWNFWLLGRSAVRAAAQGDPARAHKMVTASYVKRYVLTAVFLTAVMLSGRVSIPGAVLPLFFPKISFMLLNHGRKEENNQ